MKLSALIAAHLERDPHARERNRAVPPAVVRDVAEQVIDVLANWLCVDDVQPDMLDADDFVQCAGTVDGHGCENIVRFVGSPRDPETGEPLCGACADELRGEDGNPFGGESDDA